LYVIPEQARIQLKLSYVGLTPHAEKRRLKYEDFKKRKGKNCREANHISLPLKKGCFFTQEGLKNF